MDLQINELESSDSEPENVLREQLKQYVIMLGITIVEEQAVFKALAQHCNDTLVSLRRSQRKAEFFVWLASVGFIGSLVGSWYLEPYRYFFATLILICSACAVFALGRVITCGKLATVVMEFYPCGLIQS